MVLTLKAIAFALKAPFSVAFCVGAAHVAAEVFLTLRETVWVPLLLLVFRQRTKVLLQQHACSRLLSPDSLIPFTTATTSSSG